MHFAQTTTENKTKTKNEKKIPISNGDNAIFLFNSITISIRFSSVFAVVVFRIENELNMLLFPVRLHPNALNKLQWESMRLKCDFRKTKFIFISRF